MKRLLLLLILCCAVLIHCDSDDDDPSYEESASICLAAVLICQNLPAPEDRRQICLTTSATGACLGG
ncbi:MAG: hypothetical protein NXI24_19240 [bacterium]|nr:hypothetical protein [bacterium]